MMRASLVFPVPETELNSTVLILQMGNAPITTNKAGTDSAINVGFSAEAISDIQNSGTTATTTMITAVKHKLMRHILLINGITSFVRSAPIVLLTKLLADAEKALKGIKNNR